jgi:hypothetical protein
MEKKNADAASRATARCGLATTARATQIRTRTAAPIPIEMGVTSERKISACNSSRRRITTPARLMASQRDGGCK